MTFFDVVTGNGVISIITWIIIFTMFPVGIIMGIASLATSFYRKKNRLPLPFKMLITMLVLYLFVGFMGSVWSSIITSGALDMPTGSEKAVMFAIRISHSLYILSFTFLGTIPFMFSIAGSILILHFKAVPMLPEELNQIGEEQL